MANEQLTIRRHVPTMPPSADDKEETATKVTNPFERPFRRQPDWLMIVVIVLSLLSTVIAWLVFRAD